MAVTTAAVVGAGAAVAGAANSRKAAKDAAKSQERQNKANRDFIETQIGQAREDAASLFPAAEMNLLAGQQAALDVFGGAAPQQVQAIQAGSDAARQAILGTGTGEIGFTPDMSFMQQILPTLRAPENRFGTASGVEGSPVYVDPVSGIADHAASLVEGDVLPQYAGWTNRDLYNAALTGQIGNTYFSPSELNIIRSNLAAHTPEFLAASNQITTPLDELAAQFLQGYGRQSSRDALLNLARSVRYDPVRDAEDYSSPYAPHGAASRFLGGV